MAGWGKDMHAYLAYGRCVWRHCRVTKPCFVLAFNTID